MHTTPCQSVPLSRAQRTNLVITLNMLFKGFSDKFIFHCMSRDGPKGNVSNLSHKASCTNDTTVLFLVRQSILSGMLVLLFDKLIIDSKIHCNIEC